MFFLGLILPVCFVPGYTGASIPTQWALLSAFLLLSLWKDVRITSSHKLGAMFVAYAVLSAMWATNIYTSILGLWYVFIWALSFLYGSSFVSLRLLWQGLAIGLSISTTVAVFQALGYHPVEVGDDQLAGLLFNGTLQGTIIALVIIALAQYRLWWYMPPLLIGLILSGSRGSFLLLGLYALIRYVHWLAALFAIIIAGFVLTFWLDLADVQRLTLWGQALRHLTVFGLGPDSFNDIYYYNIRKGELFHSEFVHNDYLQLGFEFGIGSFIAFTIMALALTNTAAREWPVFACWCILAGFYFPLYTPLTAFIGCAVAGNLLRRYDPIRDFIRRRGLMHLLGPTHRKPNPVQPWRQDIPLASANSHSEA